MGRRGIGAREGLVGRGVVEWMGREGRREIRSERGK